MREVVLFGRILFALVFILSGFSHFNETTIGYAASQGVPFPGLLVPFSGLLAILGGLSIALGYYPRVGAWMITAFLVPITFKMHAFWTFADPAIAQIQQVMFLKNISMLGGALAFAYFGSGPYSLANRNPFAPSEAPKLDERDTLLEVDPATSSVGLRTSAGLDISAREESERIERERSSHLG
jgi:putative oxidoreductase